MGFLRRRADEPEGERFLMREKLLAIGDDFWIENDRGERAYKVNGKAVRLRQTFVLEDASGDEVARIQERKLSIRDKIAIERQGDTAATVRKALVGLRDRFAIDVEHGSDMKAHGNVVDHEYEIERDGDTVPPSRARPSFDRSTVSLRSRSRTMSAWAVAEPAGASLRAGRPARPPSPPSERRRTGDPCRAAVAARLGGHLLDYLRRISAQRSTPTKSRPGSRASQAQNPVASRSVV
jgi:uncharacterized protein YxjI